MALVNALDNYTPQNEGENGHIQYTWSNNFNELFSQFYFQLVRTKDTSSLEASLDGMLTNFTHKYKSFSADESSHALTYLTNLYKLIGHTRDITDGKGEYTLSYMQLYVWYQHYPELAKFAFQRFLCYEQDLGQATKSAHPYGSWKDVKYFSEYVRNKAKTQTHPLIIFACATIVERIKMDREAMRQGQAVSLAAKWCPREKGRFAWLYKHILAEWKPEYFATSKNGSINTKVAAYKKAGREFRKVLSALNRYMDTTQVKMCGKQWSEIDFNTVTSITLRKNRLAFMNKTKSGLTKHLPNEDREQCAQNLKSHLAAAMDNAQSDKPVKVHGKRASVYELVNDAILVKHNYTSTEQDKNLIDLQWADNGTQNMPLNNIIPMADTSGSMATDNCVPLYNSIGLSIRVSELANEAFKNRILTFSETPTWVNLDGITSFVEKVDKVRKCDWGYNTNFYKALKMILDTIIEANLPPSEVTGMTLAIFSDMQIDMASGENMDTMYASIEKMYAETGLKSAYKTPYKPPHILFWNLRKTDGFPTLSTQKNVTMLSGYSAVLLNAFCEKGVEALQEYTPYSMIDELLSKERYDVMGEFIEAQMK